MSAAGRMPLHRRVEIYTREWGEKKLNESLQSLTPAQRRRIKHKNHHDPKQVYSV